MLRPTLSCALLFAGCFVAWSLPAATFAQNERRPTSSSFADRAASFAAERGAERAAEFSQTGTEKGPAEKLPVTGRAISFEFVIAEFARGGKGPAAVDLESPDKVLPKLKELEAAGEIGALSRFHLSSVELTPARLQIGEQRPFVSSRGGFGGRAPGVVEAPVSYTFQNVGTIVTALSRVTDEGAVLAEIAVEKSRPALTLAKATEPPDIGRARVTTTNTQATVLIPPGQWVVLGGAQGSTEEESSQTIILVSAKAAEPASALPQLKIFSLKNAKVGVLSKILPLVVADIARVRIAIDERTNSLIVSGPKSDLEVVESLVMELDRAK